MNGSGLSRSPFYSHCILNLGLSSNNIWISKLFSSSYQTQRSPPLAMVRSQCCRSWRSVLMDHWKGLWLSQVLWHWLSLFAFGMTFLWIVKTADQSGTQLRFFFPDSPTSAWFLTPEERKIAIERIKVGIVLYILSHTSTRPPSFRLIKPVSETSSSRWNSVSSIVTLIIWFWYASRVIETLKEPKTWLFALLYVLNLNDNAHSLTMAVSQLLLGVSYRCRYICMHTINKSLWGSNIPNSVREHK